MRKFGRRPVLLIGADLRPDSIGSDKATVCASALELNGTVASDAKFEQAIWFYSTEQNQEQRAREIDILAAHTNEIFVVPVAGTEAVKTRPLVVECFAERGFVPDYDCNLSELAPGAIRLVRGKVEDSLIVGAESAFSRLNLQLRQLERMLRTRTAELEAADAHIARLEEKLLKLKQYRREIKLLKEQKQALRKSPERRIGQVLLAPYRLPQKLFRALRGRHQKSAEKPVRVLEYQAWFEQHRVKLAQLRAMRGETERFRAQPMISIITPVFNTPAQWLEETAESVINQAYQNWEMLLIDDCSTAAGVSDCLSKLAARDSRLRVFRLEKHAGISSASNRGIAESRGDWVALLDHDDLLEPDALFQFAKFLQAHPDADLIYSDEDKLTEHGLESPLLKPDWSPDFFLSYNYVGHFTAMRREIVQRAGGFRSEVDGAQDYDLYLRIVDLTPQIHHIPRVLYHWRRTENSVADNIRRKPEVLEAARRAIADHLRRRGEDAHVSVDWRTHTFVVRRDLAEPRRVSIIIPTRDRIDLLSSCIDSLVAKTSYPNYEIVVIDNDSQSDEARAYFAGFKHRLLRFSGPFNYSAINNLAVEQTESPWLLFLNNDMEVIDGDWLTIMAEQIQRREIGAVGARLLYPDETIQHAGVVLGVDGIGTHAFRGFPADDPGVNRQLQVIRNYSAVTGACLLTRRDVFNEIGGFDEERLPVTFNDVDLCLKIVRAGYRIVYTPFARLYHHESSSRRRTRVEGPEALVIRERWADVLQHDPFYNPNLSRERADFSLGT
jgi:GT2 family glycosyltransferase/BMFP domain-containing protein YqiC